MLTFKFFWHLEIENRLMSTWTSRKSQEKVNPEVIRAWHFAYICLKDMCP